ncbi:MULTISPECIES: SHOCT domain-containing protein [Haloarcula]|uniref:SHOCT domain-containing protein n=1 Tax=Haloarcula TaxID=2237 RepID=UPI0023EBD013|nr:SHOCT domain-containing protein [Halomicroarcula sp. XH51]
MSTDRSDRRLVTLLLVVLGALVVLPLFGMGFGMMGYGSMMGGMWGGGMWNGGMWNSGTAPGWMLFVGLVMPLLFLLLLVGAVYLVYRLLTDDDGSGQDAAIDELRTAYARGDLTDAEYEDRLERLREE